MARTPGIAASPSSQSSGWRTTTSGTPRTRFPGRAVESGLIDRFGFIDPTDGGETKRYSLSGSWRHAGAQSVQDVQLFGVYSDLSLFSNFGISWATRMRGDQFNQRERRILFGGNAAARHARRSACPT